MGVIDVRFVMAPLIFLQESEFGVIGEHMIVFVQSGEVQIFNSNK